MAPVTVGIVGGSGLVGQSLIPAFLNNGNYNVTLIARKGGNTAALKPYEAQGAKVVEADFDSEAELTQAFQDLEIVVSVVAGAALDSQSVLIKAAKAAGVRRFLPSEFGVDSTRPGIREYFPALGPKFAIQDELKASGLEYTIVIAGFFIETTFTQAFGFDVPSGKVTIKGNPDAPFVITSLVDIGRWTAAALLDPATKNTTLYLKGEEVTWSSAVKTIEEATGKKLDVKHFSAEELDQHIAAAPNLRTAFFDLRLRAVNDGWITISDSQKWSGQDAPSVTLASFAKEGRWNWGA